MVDASQPSASGSTSSSLLGSSSSPPASFGSGGPNTATSSPASLATFRFFVLLSLLSLRNENKAIILFWLLAKVNATYHGRSAWHTKAHLGELKVCRMRWQTYLFSPISTVFGTKMTSHIWWQSLLSPSEKTNAQFWNAMLKTYWNMNDDWKCSIHQLVALH